jgi:Zinc finger, ZZ type
MVLQASPERDRTAEEKEEIAKKYKPGDQLLVSLEESDHDTDEEDRQLVNSVRERSLAEISQSHRRGNSNSYTDLEAHGRRPRSADNRDVGRRHQHHDERIARRQVHHNVAQNAARTGATVGTSNDSARRIEHQSSLRSLLSASDVGDTTQDDIARMIMEEGLLDGIDLSGLDQTQEEELSDRLVQIFLSRHPDRSHLPRRSSDQTERARAPEHHRSRSQTIQNPSSSSTPTETSSRHPPVSRRNLLEATSDPHAHRRRASEETRRRRTSPTPVAAASTSETNLRPALRSSSDISNHRTRPSPSRPRTRESSTASISRRSTEPEGRASDIWAGIARDGHQPSITTRQVVGSSLTDSPSTTTPTDRTFTASGTILPGVSTTDILSPSNVQSPTRRNISSRPSPARQTPARASSTHYAEPSISCERCGKAGIQYELHKRCLKCKDGNYHVCLHCYRTDRGCPHYYGVGTIGEMNFNKVHHPAVRSTAEFPHVLKSQRYRQPKEGSARGTSDGKQMTNDNPASRLEDGMFCDSCQSAANGCYWQCEECNEGEWGYCRPCVNQGNCCNHSLLPIRRVSSEPSTPSPADVTLVGPATVPASMQKSLTEATLQVLSFSTECDICKYPIAPSSTRFHCLQCNEGDYDVCTNCYLKSVVSGKISKENGHGGWRRCLKGHRMIIIGYEDHDKGQRRVIVRDIVGGYTLKDEQIEISAPSASSISIASPELGTGDWSWKEGNTKRKKAGRVRTSHAQDSNALSSPSTPTSATTPSDRRGTAVTGIPPDGGFGLVLGANWSYFADDGCTDELSFPRGAEITEADNINDEWYWGYYAGKTGLFPSAYCTLVREAV